MNPSNWISIVSFVIVIVGSGFGSFMGIRVALTEVRGEIKRLEDLYNIAERQRMDVVQQAQRERAEHDRRLRWLEEREFARGNTSGNQS